MSTFLIDNQNPIVGPKNGSKQEISVHDFDLGNRRIIETTPEKIDEFVSSRKKGMDEAFKKNAPLGLLLTPIMLIPSAIIFFKGGMRSNKLVGAYLAALSVLMGLLAGSVRGKQAQQKADKEITQKFIQENK